MSEKKKNSANASKAHASQAYASKLSPPTSAPKPMISASKAMISAPKPMFSAPKPMISERKPMISEPKPMISEPKLMISGFKPMLGISEPNPIPEPTPEPMNEEAKPEAKPEAMGFINSGNTEYKLEAKLGIKAEMNGVIPPRGEGLGGKKTMEIERGAKKIGSIGDVRENGERTVRGEKKGTGSEVTGSEVTAGIEEIVGLEYVDECKVMKHYGYKLPTNYMYVFCQPQCKARPDKYSHPLISFQT
ncbi:hypothetical protein AAMO2058_000712200 [Amorphochlora amoebiformis]